MDFPFLSFRIRASWISVNILNNSLWISAVYRLSWHLSLLMRVFKAVMFQVQVFCVLTPCSIFVLDLKCLSCFSLVSPYECWDDISEIGHDLLFQILSYSPFISILPSYSAVYMLLKLTYLLTYFMVQDIIWKADSHSACQTVACFLYGTRRFIALLTNARHWTLTYAVETSTLNSLRLKQLCLETSIHP
jgi:hypothetical protein